MYYYFFEILLQLIYVYFKKWYVKIILKLLLLESLNIDFTNLSNWDTNVNRNTHIKSANMHIGESIILLSAISLRISQISCNVTCKLRSMLNTWIMWSLRHVRLQIKLCTYIYLWIFKKFLRYSHKIKTVVLKMKNKILNGSFYENHKIFKQQHVIPNYF